MLRLASTEPEWLTIAAAAGDQPAVEVRFAPITMSAVRAARQAVRRALDLDSDDMITAGDALSRELIRRGILEWHGIGGLDGAPLDPTPDHVEAFLNDHRTFEAADEVYVLPWMERDREGNGWSASPSGIGEAETREADIASSAATPSGTDDAVPATTGPTAPIAGTSRKPKKGSASGT